MCSALFVPSPFGPSPEVLAADIAQNSLEVRAALCGDEVEKELLLPRSGRCYKPSQLGMPLVLILHGGGKKLNELREIKDEASLR